jgi:hypothetical protein
MRHGITDYILDMQTTGKVRMIGGMPAWAISALAKEYVKAMKALLTFRSLERRTAISMRISYLRGMLLGAFMHRAR